jgi:hypothetical protein
VVAFVSSLILTGLLLGVVVLVAKRRPIGAPITWGEAMVAATFIFFLMFWAYGMVPHLCLTWADNELQWRPDNLLYGPFNVVKPQVLGGWFPMTINYQVVRDLVAVAIYGVFLGVNIGMWAWWNDRTKRAEAAKALPTSDYGRPLVKRGTA